MDRKNDKSKKINPVALRKESVDRKTLLGTPDTWTEPVALRKESVDRKAYTDSETRPSVSSLSARRAWIEKLTGTDNYTKAISVALRKESVDRNCSIPAIRQRLAASLSARRAWIEMLRPPACSLPAECRSPQGEHGMFLFLTVQGGFVHADIRFNFKNCYSKKLSHKII